MTQVAELAAASNRAAEQATTSTVTALSSVNETVRGMEGIRESIAGSNMLFIILAFILSPSGVRTRSGAGSAPTMPPC